MAFNAQEKAIKCIADRCEALLKRNGTASFEKWRPIELIVRDITSGAAFVPAALYETADRIFDRFNTILGGKNLEGKA